MFQTMVLGGIPQCPVMQMDRRLQSLTESSLPGLSFDKNNIFFKKFQMQQLQLKRRRLGGGEVRGRLLDPLWTETSAAEEAVEVVGQA